MVRPALPWLSQGDIFVAVPQLQLVVDQYETPKAVLHGAGPALLATRDCVLDKTNNRGEITVERLQFLPLRLLTQQDGNRQRAARSRDLNPAEVVYVGHCDGFGEGFCLLGEMYTVPAEYFRPSKQTFDHHEAEPSGHLAATRNGARLGRLEKEDLHLFRRKIAYFFLQADL